MQNSNTSSKTEILDYQRKRTPMNSNIFIEELSPEMKLSEEMIEKYKQMLEFVKTRIKVIMTTLPELKEKMQKNEKMRKKDLKLSQKLQSFMNILSIYQKSKEKLIKLIKIC